MATTAGRLNARPWAAFASAPLRAALLAAIMATVVAACATTAPRPPAPPALAGHAVPTIASVDLLAMTPEMREFTDRHARSGSEESPRAWRLAYASLDPYLLDFDYDPMVTLPADEAFRARRGNCLTFSSLFVALARSAGLEAWYQEIRMPPAWSAVNETLLVSKHVNAVVREHGQQYVIDVSRRKPGPNEQSRRLSDREATAQYYNNLGVDALVEADLALAYAYVAPRLAGKQGALGRAVRIAQTDAHQKPVELRLRQRERPLRRRRALRAGPDRGLGPLDRLRPARGRCVVRKLS